MAKIYPFIVSSTSRAVAPVVAAFKDISQLILRWLIAAGGNQLGDRGIATLSAMRGCTARSMSIEST